ncbi:fibrillarin 1 [Actinidia rufa]|uniref:Fibrillarin 1 n=1 Tax=Actinidia rufa TaxID=165716 RepID=A0A7J0E658_9ERIC|nr:fibrillarin 1 [Actinidia rufa]
MDLYLPLAVSVALLFGRFVKSSVAAVVFKKEQRARSLYRSQELPDLRFQRTCLGFFMNLERHGSRTASIGRTERFTYEVETCFCTCAGLASPGDLSRKRKRVGRPPATVLGTVSQDLRNFINMRLNWKTVKKGVRSTSRRSRKPAKSLTVGVPLDDKSTKREDWSVSESEKLSVAVLGRRFGDKLEHVPHKERKLVLQFPTPSPRTPSPLHEGALLSQRELNGLAAAQAWPGVEVNGKLVYTEDFSVVKILQGGMDLSISLVEWRGFKSVILD